MRKSIFLNDGKKKTERWIKNIHMVLLLVTITLFHSGEALPAGIICQDSADVAIDEWYPDENLNYKDRIIISTNTNTHHGIARGLFFFDIPGELTAADIKNASIYLSLCSHCGGGDGGMVGFYALNEPFNEETDTWNSLNGGHCDDTVSSSALIPNGNTWNEAVDGEPPLDVEGLDVTTLLKDNLDKVRENGIMLKFLDEHQDPCTHQNIASRESDDPLDFAPFIVINGSESDIPCPAEILFSKNIELLSQLRKFRDQVLSTTLAGRITTKVYYNYAPFISSIFLKNRELRKLAR